MIRRATAACRGCGAILMYHRVLPAARTDAHWDFNAGITTTLARFDEQMGHLARHHRVISLEDLPARHRDRGGFFVAITFDDGYRDNLVHALPVLEKYGLPVTIYVATRFPDGEDGMWWYELADICRRQDAVDFRWRGRRHRRRLTSMEAKRHGFHALHRLVLSLPDTDRETLMARIRGTEPPARYPGNCLTWDDIRRLSRHSLVTIGAHTCSHARLSDLSGDAAAREIRLSKTRIEEETGRRVRHFSYPYGSLNNFGARDIEIVSRSGFQTAVTGQCEHVSAGHGRYQLPRIPILDKDGPRRLEAKLSSMNLFYRGINFTRTMVKG
ncbi:MAG: polysaccharide deacetylase family protein [Pseudomonadota bacterium]